MFMWLIHSGILVEVRLEFMLPGHSMLPCDRRFGVLEKAFKKKETINNPQEYIGIISGAKRSTATRMGHNEFYDFKYLLQFIQFRKAKDVLFSKSRTITLSHEHPWSMLLITPAGTERVDLNKKNNREAMLTLPELFAQKYPDPSGDQHRVQIPMKYWHKQHIKISESKLLHLQQMRPYLERAGRDWVDSVTLGQRTAAPRPREDDRTLESQLIEASEPNQDDGIDDEYTNVPEPNFPPGYISNVIAEDPPPQPISTSSTPTPSTSGIRAKRKLPPGTPSAHVTKRHKSNDKETGETSSSD